MLNIALGRSSWLLVCLLAGHAAALACVLSVSLPAAGQVPLVASVLASGLFHGCLHAWRCLPMSIVAFQLDAEGSAFLHRRDGERRTARVLGSSFVAPYLTILVLRESDAWFARSVVVLPDMLSAEAFRQLRVWLKWRSRGAGAPDWPADGFGPT